MGTRLQLQTDLENILGSRNVYFQPPEEVKIKLPCIIYSLINIDISYANNLPYQHPTQYSIMIVDRNPDSIIKTELIKMPSCKFSTRYVKDNLHHEVYTIYY
jgi:hypothetical protein